MTLFTVNLVDFEPKQLLEGLGVSNPKIIDDVKEKMWINYVKKLNSC